MTKIIAVVNLKGGTGKTTICINVAAHLAQPNGGGRVLVVDFDPQANATSGLGIDGAILEHSIYDAILDQCEGYRGVPITQIILETDIENLHLAPSELDLGSAPIIMQRLKHCVGLLSQTLKPIQPFYDYILIDAPSDAGLFVLNGLYAAEHVLIPLDSSIFALEGLNNLMIYCQDVEQMTGHRIDQFTVILNRYIKSRATSKKTSKSSPSEEIEAAVKDMAYTIFTIPDSISAYRAQQKGIPICQHAPGSNIDNAYKAIANYLSSQHRVLTS